MTAYHRFWVSKKLTGRDLYQARKQREQFLSTVYKDLLKRNSLPGGVWLHKPVIQAKAEEGGFLSSRASSRTAKVNTNLVSKEMGGGSPHPFIGDRGSM